MDDTRKKSTFFPAKKLGQNFLQDPNILEKIVRLGELDRNEDIVVEVGPGFGSLTAFLAKNSKQVFAIEKDRRLIEILKKTFPDNGNVSIVEDDVLLTDFSAISTGKLKLIANLPYNISTPLLFKILDERKFFSKIIVMLQKEVGERICSGKDSKKYGMLSVLFQNYFETRLNFTVKPGAFRPRPKVDSVVISMIPLDRSRYEVEDEEFFKNFLKSAFSSRRKKLANSLAGKFDKDFVRKALEKAGIDPGRRAENLSVGDFATTSNIFYRHLKTDEKD